MLGTVTAVDFYNYTLIHYCTIVSETSSYNYNRSRLPQTATARVRSSTSRKGALIERDPIKELLP